MKLVCAPLLSSFDRVTDNNLEIVLYGYTDQNNRGTIGARLKEVLLRTRFQMEPRAWDLLSIALSCIAADTCVRRNISPDGWTRELDLCVAVDDPDFWNSQKELIERQLRFLTTDLWRFEFMGGGFVPAMSTIPLMPDEDCIVLLSGGLDSLVGTLDLVTRHNRKPLVVSQIAWGDKNVQSHFASNIGHGLRHLQLNHNVKYPGENERSQRARSLIFLAYGVLAATALKSYREGDSVPLYVCENGFISVNPPLTDGRIGSLSTRTTHPEFLNTFQSLLNAAGLRVNLENPYQFFTKGEMLTGCANQAFLHANAHRATSCGRYARNNYQHCGRCVPCLVRRAAIHTWGQTDRTSYVYHDLARDDDNHARFDDVRSMAMAIAEVETEGMDAWLRGSLSTTWLGDTTPYKHLIERGLAEIGIFFDVMGVK